MLLFVDMGVIGIIALVILALLFFSFVDWGNRSFVEIHLNFSKPITIL